MNLKHDGLDHINIYSQGHTELGRMLSNFYFSKFTCEDGEFCSVEGYFYWLGTRDERLRLLSGFNAKKLGKSLNNVVTLDEVEFRRKICAAIRCKIEQNLTILNKLKKSSLPFSHYYSYGVKKVFVPKYNWMVEFITDLRKELKEINK